MNQPIFTYDYIENQFKKVIEADYQVITCKDYINYKISKSTNKILVNRVDIDFSIKKTERLIEIFNKLKIKGSFFVRMHAPEYNPFSFENYRIIKYLIESGHELGYHSEVIDQSKIWNENPEECLVRDIEVLNNMFKLKVEGVASHGGMTGLNNLDFWSDKKASQFGLLYEAYDRQPGFNLFQESFYVSDSEWTRWKCYNKGVLVKKDNRSLFEHAQDGHIVLYSTIHPDTFFNRHFYE